MRRDELANLYLSYLRRRGREGRLSRQGHVVYGDDPVHTLYVEENSEPYFSIVVRDFWRLEDPEELSSVELVAIRVMRRTHLAKLYPLGGWVWASAGVFLERHRDFEGVFPQLERQLGVAMSRFVQLMSQGSRCAQG